MRHRKMDPQKFNFKKAIKQLERSRKDPVIVKWQVSSPPHSMAWSDLNSGWISSCEKVQGTLVPPPIARMLAEESKKRLNQNPVTSNANRTPLGSLQLKPLMSLNLESPAPPFFNQPPPQSTVRQNISSIDDKKIFDVLTRVNTIMTKVADVMGTTVRACVERRKFDNKICLYTFFQDFPWAIVGGVVELTDESQETPPPPRKIYEVWRNQFFESLRTFIPNPIFSRIKRHVDQDINMTWNVNFLEDDDFREITTKISNLKNNPMYTKLWSVSPMDCDPRDAELTAVRTGTLRQIEIELKAFWTYEKIGVHLKTK